MYGFGGQTEKKKKQAEERSICVTFLSIPHKKRWLIQNCVSRFFSSLVPAVAVHPPKTGKSI